MKRLRCLSEDCSVQNPYVEAEPFYSCIKYGLTKGVKRNCSPLFRNLAIFNKVVFLDQQKVVVCTFKVHPYNKVIMLA